MVDVGRENRLGADKVLDDTEENLIIEIENIRLWQIRIKMAVQQVKYSDSIFLYSKFHHLI